MASAVAPTLAARTGGFRLGTEEISMRVYAD